jgi:hypothetical protein
MHNVSISNTVLVESWFYLVRGLQVATRHQCPVFIKSWIFHFVCCKCWNMLNNIMTAHFPSNIQATKAISRATVWSLNYLFFTTDFNVFQDRWSSYAINTPNLVPNVRINITAAIFRVISVWVWRERLGSPYKDLTVESSVKGGWRDWALQGKFYFGNIFSGFNHYYHQTALR